MSESIIKGEEGELETFEAPLPKTIERFESFVFSMHLMFVHLTAMTLHRVLSEIKDKNDYSAPEKNFFISIEVL